MADSIEQRQRVWRLMADDEPIADLVVDGGDFPWLDAAVVEHPGFPRYRDLLRSAEAATTEACETDNWSSADIWDTRVNQTLQLFDHAGRRAHEFLLRYTDGRARWRWSYEPFEPMVTRLWRPVGQAERDLIEASGWSRFPPRLPGQPIFYPVLSEEYAVRIARDWNTNDPASGNVGYVLRFEVDLKYVARFEPQRVGGTGIDELWVPADQLDEFNRHIVGAITVVSVHRPERSSGR